MLLFFQTRGMKKLLIKELTEDLTFRQMVYTVS